MNGYRKHWEVFSTVINLRKEYISVYLFPVKRIFHYWLPHIILTISEWHLQLTYLESSSCTKGEKRFLILVSRNYIQCKIALGISSLDFLSIYDIMVILSPTLCTYIELYLCLPSGCLSWAERAVWVLCSYFRFTTVNSVICNNSFLPTLHLY